MASALWWKGEVLTTAQKAELEAKKLNARKAKCYLFQAIDCPILKKFFAKKLIWIFEIP